ncbi:MAG: ribonuclease HI [Spirochaetales bacterium]|nr:ribonuclease HI [Spirochaetales bacterium]
MAQRLDIYTDGGCTGNPGPGGWAAVILTPGEDPLELSGGADSTTNNRMEMVAVLAGLKKAVEIHGMTIPLRIHTDSQYVQKGITQWMKGWVAKGWRTAAGKPVKNKDLWLMIKDANDRLDIDWTWVKGHAGNEWNERCDVLVGLQRELFSTK